jgi:hypothetical protein
MQSWQIAAALASERCWVRNVVELLSASTMNHRAFAAPLLFGIPPHSSRLQSGESPEVAPMLRRAQ